MLFAIAKNGRKLVISICCLSIDADCHRQNPQKSVRHPCVGCVSVSLPRCIASRAMFRSGKTSPKLPKTHASVDTLKEPPWHVGAAKSGFRLPFSLGQVLRRDFGYVFIFSLQRNEVTKKAHRHAFNIVGVGALRSTWQSHLIASGYVRRPDQLAKGIPLPGPGARWLCGSGYRLNA